jgi:hypothetical protein
MREMQVLEDYCASSSILEYRRAEVAAAWKLMACVRNGCRRSCRLSSPDQSLPYSVTKRSPKKAESCGPFDAATIKSLTSRNNNGSHIAVSRAVFTPETVFQTTLGQAAACPRKRVPFMEQADLRPMLLVL